MTAVAETDRSRTVYKFLTCATGCGLPQPACQGGRTVLSFVCGVCHVKLCGTECPAGAECKARHLVS